MLSNKAKYALIALTYLARNCGQGPILISDIAKQENIPQKFLELILLELKNLGILHSKKGKGGGYSLRKSAEAITLGEVIRIIDGPLAPVPCVSLTAYQKCEECADERTCGIRLVMKDVRDAISEILDHTSIAEMVRKSDEAKLEYQEEIMFHI